MLAPFENPKARGPEAVPCPGRRHEGGEVAGAPTEIRLVEDPFGQAQEEARHAVLADAAARREQGGLRRDHAAEGEEVVFVAAGPVQEQQGTRGVGTGLEAVDEAGGILGHDGLTADGARSRPARMRGGHDGVAAQATLGRTASISARCGSRPAGSLSAWPRASIGSSTAKPGASVAISNSTPPGSRK